MTGEKSGAVAFFDVDGTLVWHDAEKVASGEYDFSSATPTPAVYEAFHLRLNFRFDEFHLRIANFN